MLRSKWKKWLLRAVGCLAALALIIVTGGAVLFRNELKTLDSFCLLYTSRRGQALSGFTGCKGSVDGKASLK